jgi:hypothetical protein
VSTSSAGSVLAGRGRNAIEKTRGLRAQLARIVSDLPDGAPRVRVDAGPADIAEALTRVEDWLEMNVRHGVWRDTRTVRAIRRQYETAVWP